MSRDFTTNWNKKKKVTMSTKIVDTIHPMPLPSITFCIKDGEGSKYIINKGE